MSQRCVGQVFENKIFNYSTPVTESGCWIWMGAASKKGGHSVTRYNGKQIGVHRASWQHFNGKIPEGMWVLHKCDVPSCVNPDHLFLGTPKDNTSDMWAKGRADPPRGERNRTAVLSKDDVIDIRFLISCGMKDKQIADLYEVTKGAICGIRINKNWKSV